MLDQLRALMGSDGGAWPVTFEGQPAQQRAQQRVPRGDVGVPAGNRLLLQFSRRAQISCWNFNRPVVFTPAVGEVVNCQHRRLVEALSPTSGVGRCGGEVRPATAWSVADTHEPFRWRPTTLLIRVRHYQSRECRRVWRQDTTKAAEPRVKITRPPARSSTRSVLDCECDDVARSYVDERIET